MDRTPGSKTSKTPFSAHCDSPSIVFMIESRAREVGLAAINLTSYEIALSQFVDTLQYTNAASMFYALEGVELVLSKTAEGEALHTQVNEQLEGLTVTFVPRKLFDELKGVELYSKACVKVQEVDFESKFVCMAALAALHQFMELQHNVRLFCERLKITFHHLDQVMRIDAETAKALCLVVDREGNAQHALASLFKCSTPMGTRLTRARLLQPFRDPNLISQYQDAVSELLRNDSLRAELLSLLSRAPNTDALTARLVQQVTDQSETVFRFQVLSVMALKQTLQVAIGVGEVLRRGQPEAHFLRQALWTLEDKRVEWLLAEVDKVVDEGVLYNKNQSLNKLQSMYLVRAGTYSLLDGTLYPVARKVYTDTVDEIFRLADSYKSQFNDPKLKVVYTEARKYHLEMSEMKKGHATVEELVQLIALSDRASSASSEVLAITYNFIEDVVCKARSKLPCIYNAAHWIAELDLILGFAGYAMLHASCQPELSRDGFRLTQVRHPLLETILKRDVVSSDITFAPGVLIVTGPNASGKTTLLTEIALLSVLTQVGAHIPAQAAALPIVDQVFTRSGEGDSLEQGSSSFLTEMKGVAYLLRGATKESLVLVDEVCKGTTLEDGVALAWAVIEELARRGCFSLVSTHFSQLTQMQGRVPGLRNLVLKDFTAKEGCNEVRRYGLELAKASSLPGDLVAAAESVYSLIEARTQLLV